MANKEGIITEDIRSTIAVGLMAYDNEGKRIGPVDEVDRTNGYAAIRKSQLSDKDLYVPFSLITNIDPRDLFLAKSKAELRANYTNLPPRSTFVEDFEGTETATTTQLSGYDSLPMIVKRVKVDEVKQKIAVGDHVYSADMADLGKIKQYDPATGWMMVESGPLAGKRDLLIPVTLVEDVDQDGHAVYLVWPEAELRQKQDLEPANVIFVQAG